MVNAFLTPPGEDVADTEAFVQGLISGDGARGSGGFSLVCGRIGQPLAVVSNRMQKEGEVKWVGKAKAETVGLSNAAFGDQSWPKVVNGEKGMQELVQQFVRTGASKEQMIAEILKLLSSDTLPKRKEGEGWISYVRQLRNSIFIPKLGSDKEIEAQTIAAADSHVKVSEEKASSGAYGTQKQTIVLVSREGQVTFVEKTLYDEQGSDIRDGPQSTQRFQFNVDLT